MADDRNPVDLLREMRDFLKWMPEEVAKIVNRPRIEPAKANLPDAPKPLGDWCSRNPEKCRKAKEEAAKSETPRAASATAASLAAVVDSAAQAKPTIAAPASTIDQPAIRPPASTVDWQDRQAFERQNRLQGLHARLSAEHHNELPTIPPGAAAKMPAPTQIAGLRGMQMQLHPEGAPGPTKIVPGGKYVPLSQAAREVGKLSGEQLRPVMPRGGGDEDGGLSGMSPAIGGRRPLGGGGGGMARLESLMEQQVSLTGKLVDKVGSTSGRSVQSSGEHRPRQPFPQSGMETPPAYSTAGPALNVNNQSGLRQSSGRGSSIVRQAGRANSVNFAARSATATEGVATASKAAGPSMEAIGTAIAAIL